jgi:hypothetical protein
LTGYSRSANSLDGNFATLAEYACRPDCAIGSVLKASEPNHSSSASVADALDAVYVSIRREAGTRACGRRFEHEISNEVLAWCGFLAYENGPVLCAGSSSRFDIVTACHPCLRLG